MTCVPHARSLSVGAPLPWVRVRITFLQVVPKHSRRTSALARGTFRSSTATLSHKGKHYWTVKQILAHHLSTDGAEGQAYFVGVSPPLIIFSFMR
jgi:hypothetical protein